VTRRSSDQASQDAYLHCDVGLPTVWATHLAMNGKRRLIGSFWHGDGQRDAHANRCEDGVPGRQVIFVGGVSLMAVSPLLMAIYQP